MTVVEVANHVSSVVLILVCWNLSHLNALKVEPYGRVIAFGYAATALCLSGTALFRYADFDPAWLFVCTKSTLILTLGAVTLRAEQKKREVFGCPGSSSNSDIAGRP